MSRPTEKQVSERELEVPSALAIVTSAPAGGFEQPVITGQQLIRKSWFCVLGSIAHHSVE